MRDGRRDAVRRRRSGEREINARERRNCGGTTAISFTFEPRERAEPWAGWLKGWLEAGHTVLGVGSRGRREDAASPHGSKAALDLSPRPPTETSTSEDAQSGRARWRDLLRGRRGQQASDSTKAADPRGRTASS